MKKIADAQKYLREIKADGWLIYDFQANNPLGLHFLGVAGHLSRRFFYWIPVQGEPLKIVHAIESQVLDKCPGSKKIYSTWQSLESELKGALANCKKVAMEYSPKNAIPYISKVDGGTLELIRSFGVEVISSGDFLPHFTAVITPKQAESHIRACSELDRIVNGAWKWIASHLSQNITEYDVQQKIIGDFQKMRLTTESPIVGVNENSADPHYQPSKERSKPIRKGDFILIDLWAKEKEPMAVYGDITRVAVAADKPTPKQQEVFQIVRNAQRAAVSLLKEGKKIKGFEVDDAARNVIKKAGFGPYFTHRTGHSIEIELHGSGAHMDNLEMHDVRPILPSTCFSIEPGIYLPGEFGVRLEHDIYIHPDGLVEVTGGEEDEIVCLC